MNGIVCHFTPADRPAVASARITNWLAERYGLDICDSENPDQIKEHDLAICVSSASGFASAELREQIGEICALAKNYVFVQNDYLTSQAGQIGKYMDIYEKDRNKRRVWSTIPKACKNPWDKYINWNQLTWDPQNIVPPVYDALFYYGAPRKGRLKYFERYFGGPQLPYDAVISTSTRTTNKYKAVCNDEVQYIPPFEHHSVIGEYPMSIYLEDEVTNRKYCSPANRFYECLSNGVAQVFDASCAETFRQAKIDIRPYIVRNQKDVSTMLSNWMNIRNFQIHDWSKGYKVELALTVDAEMDKVLGK